MRARYYELQAVAGETGAAIDVRFEIENRSNAEWSARDGYHIGWQVNDPETQTFITEGEWIPLEVGVAPGARQKIQTKLVVPEQDGPYRVFLSPLHEQRGGFCSHGGEL